MKRILAAAITLGLVGGVLWFAKPDTDGLVDAAASPMDCIDRMFSAAARGDVEAYVACFTGIERNRMDREFRQAKQASAVNIEDSLRGSVADLKSWVVLDPPANSDQLQECSLLVERIYRTRVDRQKLDFRRDSQGWKIHRTYTAEPYQPPIPYGTSVFEQ